MSVKPITHAIVSGCDWQKRAQEAKPVVPHGPGFQFISRVISITEDEVVTAEFDYTGTEEIKAADHFPGNPIYPGIFFIEAMTHVLIQTARVNPNLAGKQFRFSGIDRCRFRGEVTPGTTITYVGKIVDIKMGVGSAEVTAFAHGKKVAEATLRFAIVDPSK